MTSSQCGRLRGVPSQFCCPLPDSPFPLNSFWVPLISGNWRCPWGWCPLVPKLFAALCPSLLWTHTHHCALSWGGWDGRRVVGAATSNLLRRYSYVQQDTGGECACLGLEGIAREEKNFFFPWGNRVMRNTPQRKALSEQGPVVGPAPAGGALRVCMQLWRPRAPAVRVGLSLGCRQAAREHWGTSVCTLYVSQLSLELWQSLALPGLFLCLGS